MTHTPRRCKPNNSRIRPVLAVLLTLLIVASSCASDEPVAIATNDGGVLVKPPDVLDGDAPVEATDADAVDDADAAPAPDVVDFTWFDGTPGSTADFAGEPTVVNFWASNCPPCVAEMPEFESVYQAIGDRVSFVGVNVADIRTEADRLADQTGVSYPLVEDPDSAVFRAYRGFVMPTTVFLNETGQPVFTWSGVLTGEELRILIDRHIAPGSLDV